MMKTLLLLILAVAWVVAQRPLLQKPQRLPLQRTSVVLKTPASYAKRILRLDHQTGDPVYYDPKPRVEILDKRSGKYAFKWIGYDGQEKTIIYLRFGAVDVVMSASVARSGTGKYVFVYEARNLPSSGQSLAGFAVQNYSSDVTPIRINDVHIGHMSNNNVMKKGNWLRFAPLSDYRPVVEPGRSIQFSLESSSPPGVVGCHVHGGQLGIKGVGEEMPQELENVLPGYTDWPGGLTIGPVERLKTLSTPERAKYVLELLPQFQKLGWMASNVRPRYEQLLSRDDIEGAYHRAEHDLKAGRITTEVLSILQGLKMN